MRVIVRLEILKARKTKKTRSRIKDDLTLHLRSVLVWVMT